MDKFSEVLKYLYAQLPCYQREGVSAYKSGLDNSLKLDEMCGYPHKKYMTVHVAGTNGKGSVSHMISGVLQECGYKVGLYTSPHLKDFRERIRVGGEMISESAVVDFVNRFCKESCSTELKPSFFELTVAMAFDYFAKKSVDIAVVETGLGGRLDSTNIILPVLSVITNIGMDHTSILGNTVERIATEKAGIIKRGVPVVIGEVSSRLRYLFELYAKKQDAAILYADEQFECASLSLSANSQVFDVCSAGEVIYSSLALGLLGRYQVKNLIIALTAISKLESLGMKIPEKALRSGLQNVVRLTGLSGRWQVLGKDPYIVCDIAHNESGIEQVISQIEQTPHKCLHVVLGFVNDKDIGVMLDLLPRDAKYYFTKAELPRSLDAVILTEQARGKGLTGVTFSSVVGAFSAAVSEAGSEDMIFVGGSSFVVAELLCSL